MISIKVKICGITNLRDAKAAIDAGADLLGFNFYPESPRYISPDKVRRLVSKLPTFIDTVGVFVNAEVDEVKSIARNCRLDWVQLHGDETPGFCASLDELHFKVIKAIRVKDSADIEYAHNFSTDALLLDAYHPDQYGGSGKSFNWKMALRMIGHLYGRVFLAGGITPENVAEAVTLGIYGIDVCSGIESRPGKKDYKKMRKLFENISNVRI